MTDIPFQTLTIDHVLDTVEYTLQQKLTSLCIPRNSYINRVYELERADSRERIIVKFYRPGRWPREMIQTEHDFLKTLHEEELPVIPPLTCNGHTLHSTTLNLEPRTLNNIFFAIFPKKGGRAIDEFDRALWEQTGRLLARIHNIGKTWSQPNRLHWTPDIASQQHLETLHSTGVIPIDFQTSFNRVTEQLLQRIQPLFTGVDCLLLHGDCHRGNFIHRPGEGLFLVDFDDMAVGPAVQDLWMLFPGHPEQCKQEISWFLEGYDLFREFRHGTFRLIPALRGMRLIHFAAWCAIQSREPHFKHHFPHWGTARYWNELIRDLQGVMEEVF